MLPKPAEQLSIARPAANTHYRVVFYNLVQILILGLSRSETRKAHGAATVQSCTQTRHMRRDIEKASHLRPAAVERELLR